MNKGRRIEIEIRRREISLAVQRSTAEAGDRKGQEGAAAERPERRCPLCGEEWVLVFDATAAVPPVTGESVAALLAALPLHLHTSSTGHLWVCARSLRQIKEHHQ